MARADLMCDLIKFGLAHDDKRFMQSAEAVCAEEREKQHTVLAERIEKILLTARHTRQRPKQDANIVKHGTVGAQSLFFEKAPTRRMSELILPNYVQELCEGLIEEQLRSDLLRSYGLEPRHKMLFVGAPGNGKTTLAEAIAESLMIPFYTVRYEQLIGSYLGETASRLSQLFDYARTRPCVLFFDEFETLGKERGDTHETGEIKRVVSSLLLQIDSLPSYVIVIAATNHDILLDKAAWRRFQIRIELPLPTRAALAAWLSLYERKNGFDFGIEPETIAKKIYGCSFAEAEEIATEIYRRYVLSMPTDNTKRITNEVLGLWAKQRRQGETSERSDG
ncbi:AAA family ATPase [Parvibacter caecicola]|uniref:ATP-binding protein n=1 Tax=Parvibacter caecicola TaxID=747645 RepID=A0A4T9T8J6_9ACTN|nr:ATP-binding protein [Parvibacter caecicola]TJW11370.1 ATP-binding protein [Parvibacter caecicola]